MNLSEYDNKMYGLAEGVQYGQNERVDELNTRISERFYPDSPLPPNFNTRPVPTKYSIFPMLNTRMPANVSIDSNYDYAEETNFTPPIGLRGPPAGFINNVDTESTLRNQFFGLQKSDQSVYIPSTESDLYKVTIASRRMEQTHPLLFETPKFIDTNAECAQNIGRDRFHNYTRTQLRNGGTQSS